MKFGNFEHGFSKDLAQDLRDETARKLREARSMPKDSEYVLKMKKGDIPEYEPSVQKTLESVKGSIIGRIFKTYKFKDLSYELDGMLERARDWEIEKIKYNYQAELDRIFNESPLSEEEMETYLSEEAMKSMNLEDYLVLLKRLSGNFVTHVTRQGVREQGWFHNSGMGEFFDSFIKVLKDKKLESFMANFMTDPNSIPYLVSTIKEIKNETGLSGEALVERLLEITDRTHDDIMPADQSSVHMATNTVASYYYGAEKGYDFYFYFPAEFIATNYFHHHKMGQSSIVEKRQGLTISDASKTDKHNDLAVWNGGRGVPIEAGITCIPKDVMVDRETGSQYRLVDSKPIKKEDGSGYELAEDTITSEEFWESYFNANPSMRPNKLIYGHFETMPRFDATRHYEPILKDKVFRTSGDIPDYEQFDSKTLTEYKAQLADFVRKLESDGII